MLQCSEDEKKLKMKKKTLLYPTKNSKKDNHSEIESIQASFNCEKAQLTELFLIKNKIKHSIVPSSLEILGEKDYQQKCGQPYLFAKAKNDILFSENENLWKCERWETLEKRGASSIRFFLSAQTPKTKITLELTYTLNWLDHLVVNYRIKTEESTPVMIPHPFFFSTNEKVHIIFDHKSDVLWHKGKSNEEKIYCAYLLKKFENEKIKVEKGVSLRTKSKKQDLSIDIYHSTRALECGIIEFKKKSCFWVNSFDFHIDNKPIKTTEKNENERAGESDYFFHTPQIPFTIKNSDDGFYSYTTLFYFRLL